MIILLGSFVYYKRLSNSPFLFAHSDVIYSILNKLTPEKFDKLTDSLLNLGLNTPSILKGVILLIFEKALEEPKYSSMYAQLCKKLSVKLGDNAPPGQQIKIQNQEQASSVSISLIRIESMSNY